MSAPPHNQKSTRRSPSPPAALDSSQQEMTASDEISQSQFLTSLPKLNLPGPSTSTEDPSTMSVDDDPDNPFTCGFTSAAAIPPISSFQSASLVAGPSRKRDRSPTPEDREPPEQDYDAWFQPHTSASTSFQSASSGFQTATPSFGFTTASSKTFQVSSVALEQAKKKMKQWEAEISDADAPVSASQPAQRNSTFASASSTFQFTASPRPPTSFSSPRPPSPQRSALSAMENMSTPATPTPRGFVRPFSSKPTPFKSPLVASSSRHRPKPFKSPLIIKPPPSSVLGPPPPDSPPDVPTGYREYLLATGRHPSQRPHPLATGYAFPEYVEPEAHDPEPEPTPPKAPTPKYTTPSQGSALSESLRLAAETLARSFAKPPPPPPPKKPPQYLSSIAPPKRSDHVAVFDLSRRSRHKTLRGSLKFPQSYTAEELQTMGITHLDALKQITPESALSYSFTTDDPSNPIEVTDPPKIYGAAEAFQRLADRGCKYATKPWIDNHYALILWKLAGMIVFDPESEKDPRTRRWCFREVIRQLLYRYERELNLGQRPALRLITAQDAPSQHPMVLCVSKIIWTPTQQTEEGENVPEWAELEVTDGWYRLRARIDAPLTTAIRRGIIKVGRKIGMAGARLDSDRKDPQEILDAYGSVRLILNGNGTQMMPWHIKLGWYTKGPCVSTLHKLSAYGGMVPVLDITVLRAYPVAFVEFTEDENGERRPSQPMCRADENRTETDWRRRRDEETDKMRDEVYSRFNRMVEYLDTLDGMRRSYTHDPEPDTIAEWYDILTESDQATGWKLVHSLTEGQAFYLAEYVRRKLDKLYEEAEVEITEKLREIIPPRDVRAFRVLAVQDSRVCKRPRNRVAKITVWDPLKIEFTEGRGHGEVRTGDRFMVTNLMPQQLTAWMDTDYGSEIMLVSKPQTTWRCLYASPTGTKGLKNLYEMPDC